jgi:hypothetical protein
VELCLISAIHLHSIHRDNLSYFMFLGYAVRKWICLLSWSDEEVGSAKHCVCYYQLCLIEPMAGVRITAGARVCHVLRNVEVCSGYRCCWAWCNLTACLRQLPRLRGVTWGAAMCLWAGIAQSVQRLATGWTVRGSNPGGGEIFRTRPDRPWGLRSLLYNGYQVCFPGVKRPWRGVDHPDLVAGLKKEYNYTSTPPLGLRGLF